MGVHKYFALRNVCVTSLQIFGSCLGCHYGRLIGISKAKLDRFTISYLALTLSGKVAKNISL